ncbi:MAG: hypothetical protein WAT74_06665 [Flavobacteriales bacterium]
MNIDATKIQLTQHLLAIMDEKVLERVVNFFRNEVPVEAEDGITDEEYAEFDEAIAKHERGEVRFYSEEESIRLIREAGKSKP